MKKIKEIEEIEEKQKQKELDKILKLNSIPLPLPEKNIFVCRKCLKQFILTFECIYN